MQKKLNWGCVMNEIEKWQMEIENRMSTVEAKVGSIKEDLKDIKAFQNKLMFWIIGTMATSMLSLLTLIFTLLKK